jgi:hypothetical protein
MSRSTTARQRQLFAAFLLALFPAVNALHPRLDEDTWWHLAVGEWVIQHGTVPTTDPFSRISQEKPIPWIAYSWLHEVMLATAFRIGGLNGVLVFRHLLDSLTFLTVAWFILRGAEGRARPLIVLALMTAALVPMSLERPWHYTIAFCTLTMHATIEWRTGTPAWRFWWLIPIYVLWANLHIQFVLGFGVLGLGLLATTVERCRAGNSSIDWKWLALIAACFLATLVNPYHVRLFGVVWEYATQTRALQFVTELAPPPFLPGPKSIAWWNWALAILLAWAAWNCLSRRLPIFDTAFLVAGAFFSLRMQRDIWFGGLCAAAVLTRLSMPPRPASGRSLLAGLSIVVIVAVVLARVVWELGPGQKQSASAVNRREYPAGATEFVREHRPPGPIFNHFNWGGYLIWTLPEYPVSLDGRTNLYGEERLQRAFESWRGSEGWSSDSDLLAAGVVLAPKKLNTQLTDLLRGAADRWRIVYEDEVAVVFIRIDPER